MGELVFESLYPSSRIEWLSLRMGKLGASELPALFGIHDHLSTYKLAALKRGLIEDENETKLMRQGRLLEPVAVELLREKRPDSIFVHNVIPGGVWLFDEEHGVAATPDCIERVGAIERLIQIKVVERSRFKEHWINEEDEHIAPMWTLMQSEIERIATGCEEARVAALIVGYGVDLVEFETPPWPGLEDALIEAAADFWRRLQAGDEFSPNVEKDGRLLRDLLVRSHKPGAVVDLSNDNRFKWICVRDHILKEELAAIKKEREQIRTEAMAKMCSAEIAMIGGDIVGKLKIVHKPPVVQRAVDFPRLWLKALPNE